MTGRLAEGTLSAVATWVDANMWIGPGGWLLFTEQG